MKPQGFGCMVKDTQKSYECMASYCLYGKDHRYKTLLKYDQLTGVW